MENKSQSVLTGRVQKLECNNVSIFFVSKIYLFFPFKLFKTVSLIIPLKDLFMICSYYFKNQWRRGRTPHRFFLNLQVTSQMPG